MKNSVKMTIGYRALDPCWYQENEFKIQAKCKQKIG